MTADKPCRMCGWIPSTSRDRDSEGEAMTDAFWHCKFCGDHAPAEAPYVVGDKEPCSECGQGTAHVMTLKECARFESEIARGLRAPERSYTDSTPTGSNAEGAKR